MSIAVIVTIVLSIALLTILMVYLSSQTGMFNRASESYSSESNVDAFIGTCNLLVEGDSVYSYCCEKKEVVFGDNVDSIEVTCVSAKNLGWSSGRISIVDCSAVVCAE